MSSTAPRPPVELAELAHKIWYWPVIRGVLTLLFGIVALVAPVDTAKALVQIFGIFVIVDGVVSLVDGARRRGSATGSFSTALGIIGVIFGLVLLLLPKVALGVVLILIALWALILGVFQLTVSLGARRAAGRSWVWGTIGGLLLIALAVTAVVNPGWTVGAFTVVFGFFAIIIGITLIVLGLRLRSLPVGAGKGAGQGTFPGGGEVIEGEIVD